MPYQGTTAVPHDIPLLTGDVVAMDAALRFPFRYDRCLRTNPMRHYLTHRRLRYLSDDSGWRVLRLSKRRDLSGSESCQKAAEVTTK